MYWQDRVEEEEGDEGTSARLAFALPVLAPHCQSRSTKFVTLLALRSGGTLSSQRLAGPDSRRASKQFALAGSSSTWTKVTRGTLLRPRHRIDRAGDGRPDSGQLSRDETSLCSATKLCFPFSSSPCFDMSQQHFARVDKFPRTCVVSEEAGEHEMVSLSSLRLSLP